MFDDAMMTFEVSHDMDDWSRAETVMAYDLGEAVDEYVRLRKAREEDTSALPSRLYVRLKGEDQVYEVATETAWEETEDDRAALADVETVVEADDEPEE